MKVNRILFIAIAALCITACDENEQFEKELYKKVIYALSDNDLSFPVIHHLNQEESSGFVSIGCGGTNQITQDVTVELEPDDEGIANYNKLMYDIEESKFARELDPERYSIPSLVTVLKANSKDCYSTIPVHIRPEGLSPDSTYLIPLRIKSVSAHEVNPEKRSVLYRVVLRNDYAMQMPATYYKVTGSYVQYKENSEEIEHESTFSLSRVVVPLTKNSIRFFAGLNTYETSSLTKEDIDKYGIRVTINNNALAFSSIGTAQVEIIDDPEGNLYYRYNTNLSTIHVFFLHYRYRLLKDGADGSNGDADYEAWHDMTETMTYSESTLK